MHIPDGYLGPPTYLGSFALCAALWGTASRRVQRTLEARRIPLLALSSAFCFVIMMFNIPIPGGTTGHAVGGALIAIAIGPWAAALSISVALVLQALVFGDGGITAIGANCLNIAFIMPFSGWLTYRALMRFRVMQERLMWQAFAAGVSGWVGLNLAALTTAVMFGIQPILHHTAEGRPLYAPYPLSVAVPFMVLEHMVLFGLVEGLVTGMVVYGLLKSRTRWIVEASGGIR